MSDDRAPCVETGEATLSHPGSYPKRLHICYTAPFLCAAGCSLVDGGMSAAAETTDAPAGARSPSPTAGEPAGPPTSGSAPPLPTARTSSANGGRASSASSDDVAMPAEGGDAEPLRVCVDSRERLRWSPALHQCFVDAVNALGGSAFAKVRRAARAAAAGAASQPDLARCAQLPRLGHLSNRRAPLPPCCSPRTLWPRWLCPASPWPTSSRTCRSTGA